MSENREVARSVTLSSSTLSAPHRLQLSRIKVLPKITLVGNLLTVEGKTLSLGRKPLTRKLFEIFIQSPGATFRREDLVQLIYCESPLSFRSERYRSALGQNIVKLVSRARYSADKAFNRQEKWIDWFCYDAERGCWSFFRLTHHYLRYKEREYANLLAENGGVKVLEERL